MINRRDFLKRSSKGTAGFAIGGYVARAYGKADALGPLAASAVPETDRILVIIRMDGGNDGLNTLVNYENDAYYEARPTINIPKADVLTLDENLGLNPDLAGFHKLFKEGKMAGVQGIGYPNPNRSHFRSTDIWMTASDSNEFITNGWLGRYMELANPDFSENLPEHPLAIDIGPVLSLALLGQNTAMGIALRNPNQFFNLVNQGNKIIDDNKILTPAGYELDFIRQVNFESLQYSAQVREAANNGENKVEYPDTTLASQLSLIARLISGGLNTRVFLVRQGGYDTHANQIVRHSDLLQELDGAVLAFQRDLEGLSLQDRVLGMTVSEFGRRTKENGSVGTDHGTSAPLFLFGSNVAGGVQGTSPDFETLDGRGDFFHDYHFRQIYASVLSQWFGVSDDILNTVFPSKPSMLSLIQTGASRELADFTGDGKVDFSDFIKFASEFGGTNPRYDLDGSGGKIDFADFLAFARAFGK